MSDEQIDPADDPGLDPDQPGQEIDESLLGEEYPPDHLIGLDGVIGDADADDDDEDDDEDDDDDVDVDELDDGDEDEDEDDDEDDEYLGDEEPEVWDEEPVISAVVRSPEEPGQLADDDEFTGDETERDYATENVPPAAEDEALHIEPHRLERPD